MARRATLNRWKIEAWRDFVICPTLHSYSVKDGLLIMPSQSANNASEPFMEQSCWTVWQPAPLKLSKWIKRNGLRLNRTKNHQTAKFVKH